MRRAVPLLSIALTLALSLPGFAAGLRVVGWSELAPEPVPYDNPFSQLEPEQLDGLRKLLRFRQAADGGDDIITPDEATTLRSRLEADGLDVNRLFAQRDVIMEARRRAATDTNPELLGEAVRIPGYLLPLELDDRKAVEFLLVPTVGACIHTPPPPANQMIHVRYPTGFEVKGLYTPIWVSGELRSESKIETVRYADGETRVEVSYFMLADTVEAY